MKNVCKKSVSLLLGAILMLAPMAACGQSDKGEDEVSLSNRPGNRNQILQQTGSTVGNATGDEEITAPEYYKVPNEFRFVAYSTPPKAGIGAEGSSFENNPNHNTEANWQTMADCGFNFAQPIYYEQSDDDIINSLTNAEKTGMKILVTNYDKNNPNSLPAIAYAGGTYQEAWNTIKSRENEIKARYNRFAEFSSFAGIFGCDEPDATMFESIAAAQDWFELNYPDYEFYINLLPNYAKTSQLFGKKYGQKGYNTYADYLARFCETVNPYIVSYDHYCLIDDGSYIMSDFFYNLAVGATNAKKLEDAYGWEVPFYIYLQSMGFEGKVNPEYYQQWAWQVYTSLAYGVTGIQAFCYWPLMADEDDAGNEITNALVNRNGEKTDLYDWVKKTIDDIKAIEDVYMSLNWEGTSGWTAAGATLSELLSYTNGNEKLSSYEFRDFQDISAITTNCEILVGQFASKTNKDNKAYMVTNAYDVMEASIYENWKKADVNLTFANVTAVDVYKPGENGVAERVTLENGVLNLSIPTGEGFLVVPVTE